MLGIQLIKGEMDGGGLDEIVAEKNKQKLKANDELQIDVMHDVDWAHTVLTGARAKLGRQIISPTNLDGCLSGLLDEYLEAFGPTVEKLRGKFAQNRADIDAQVKFVGKDTKIERQIA